MRRSMVLSMTRKSATASRAVMSTSQPAMRPGHLLGLLAGLLIAVSAIPSPPPPAEAPPRHPPQRTEQAGELHREDELRGGARADGLQRLQVLQRHRLAVD